MSNASKELSDFIDGLIDPSNSEKLSNDDLDNLSLHELEALAGLRIEDTEKMAGMLMDCGPYDRYASWLDQFTGTPLHAKALALCEQELQLDAERLRRRQESRDEDLWTKGDEIRLNKDVLTLELHKLKSQTSAGQGKDPTMVPAEPAAPKAETKTSALLEAVKRANDNDTQTTGQVNNGDPSNPEWPPRAALGVDAAGRRATPEELAQQRDTATPQHVAPAHSGTSLPAAPPAKTASLVDLVKSANAYCLPDGSGVMTGKVGKTDKKKIAKAEKPETERAKNRRHGASAEAAGALAGGGLGIRAHANEMQKWMRAPLPRRGLKGKDLAKALGKEIARGSMHSALGGATALAGIAGGAAIGRAAHKQHLKNKKEKTSGDLSTEQREDLGKKQFALPEQRKFPIPDEAHARNALARAAQFGSPAVQAKVRSAVEKKFPGVALTSASKPEKPTVKKTITKTAYQTVGGFPGTQLVGGVGGAAKKLKPVVDAAKKVITKTSGRKLSMTFAKPLMRVSEIAAHAPGASQGALSAIKGGIAAKAGKAVPLAAVRGAAPAAVSPLASAGKFPLKANQGLVRAGLTPVV